MPCRSAARPVADAVTHPPRPSRPLRRRPASSSPTSIAVRMCGPDRKGSVSRSCVRPGGASRRRRIPAVVGGSTSSSTGGGTSPSSSSGSTRHGRVRPRSTRRDPRPLGPRRSAGSPRRRYLEPVRTRGVVLPPARPAALARPAQGRARPSMCASQRHPHWPLQSPAGADPPCERAQATPVGRAPPVLRRAN